MSFLMEESVVESKSEKIHENRLELTCCCFRCVVTNDGRSSDLQVWELEGDNSGELNLPLRLFMSIAKMKAPQKISIE